MSDYNRIKNLGITSPVTGMELGSNGNRFGNLYISGNIVLDNTSILSSSTLVPKITSITYVGNDTAADPAGGQTITINGSGFMSGLFVYLGGAIVGSATYVSATTATFVAPAKTVGIYTLVIANPDGGTATYITGIQYSGVPTWSTTAGSLANVYEYGSVSTNVVATGDAPITYSVAAGNSLPSGLTIGSGNGLVSGTTAAVASGSTTTNFYLNASDGQNQDTTRNFSITVNADVVTWSSPADNTSYSLDNSAAMSNVSLSASSAAGKTISYTANSLPTGVSLTGSTIIGTPTVTGNSSSLITATAATTGKTATRTLNWAVQNPTDTYFKNTTLLLSGDSLNGATWIKDASTNNFGVTVYGDAKASAQTPFNKTTYPTSGSGYFDGSGDYLLNTTSNLQIASSTNFTVECWVYILTTKSTDQGMTVFAIGTEVSNRIQFTISGSSARVEIYAGALDLSGGTVSLNTWTHVAWVRSGSTVSIYINGTSVATGTYSNVIGNSNGFIVGANRSISTYFSGYISNLRVLNGTAQYTSAFTPSTAPLTAIANTSLLTLQNAQSTQNNSFIDSSTQNLILAPSGNVTQGTFTPFSQTGFSTYFNGSSQGMVIPNSTFSGNWVNSNFTFEAWLYVVGNGPNGFLWLYGQNNNDCLYLGLSITDKNINYGSFNGLSYNYSFSTSNNIWEKNRWFHVAFVRNSTSGNTNSMKIFLDGVLVGTGNTGTFGVFDNSFFFNNAYSPWADLDGYCAGLRITNSAIYSSAFTPAPLTNTAGTRVLLCTGRTHTDASSNNYSVSITGTPSIQAFTPFAPTADYSASTVGGSGYFQKSTTDYIGLPNGSVALGSNDFSIEAWIYPLDRSYAYSFFAGNTDRTTASGSSITLSLTSGNGYFEATHWFGGTPINLYSPAIPVNAWTHLAVCRTSGTLGMFVNGVRVSTASCSGSINAGSATYNPSIGSNGTGTADNFSGYISNLRVIIGSGGYSATSTTITLPTAPVTATANTKVLANFTNAGIYDATSKNDLRTVGTSQLSSTQSKFGGTSMRFDGSTSSWLSIPFSQNLNLSTGSPNWTLECWVYVNSYSNAPFVFNKGGLAAVNYTNYGFAISNAGLAYMHLGNNSGETSYNFGTISTGVWYYLVGTRQGNTIRTFLNGTLVTNTSIGAAMTDNGQELTVGVLKNLTTNVLDGYVDDLRITKGIARYTANFTSPTTAFVLR